MSKNFIEISGTPKSGKDTIIALLKKDERIVDTKIEVFYQDILQSGIDKNLVKELMYWTSCKTICNILNSNFSTSHVDKLIIFNRGGFDRLAWLETYRALNRINQADYYNMINFILNSPNQFEHTKLLVIMSNPQFARKRDPRIISGESKERIMNREFLTRLNRGYDIAIEKFGHLLKKITIIDEKEIEIPIETKYSKLYELCSM